MAGSVSPLDLNEPSQEMFVSSLILEIQMELSAH